MQQTYDFFDDDDCFQKLDSEFEQILSQVDGSVTTTVSASSTNTTATFSTATASCIYKSPKGEKAVEAVRASSVARKTKEQTDWAVRIWTDWATTRNSFR